MGDETPVRALNGAMDTKCDLYAISRWTPSQRHTYTLWHGTSCYCLELIESCISRLLGFKISKSLCRPLR